jgi:hypothetical protein
MGAGATRPGTGCRAASTGAGCRTTRTGAGCCATARRRGTGPAAIAVPTLATTTLATATLATTALAATALPTGLLRMCRATKPRKPAEHCRRAEQEPEGGGRQQQLSAS